MQTETVKSEMHFKGILRGEGVGKLEEMHQLKFTGSYKKKERVDKRMFIDWKCMHEGGIDNEGGIHCRRREGVANINTLDKL